MQVLQAETCSNILENWTCVRPKTSKLTSTDTSSALTTPTTARELEVLFGKPITLLSVLGIFPCVLDIYHVPQCSVSMDLGGL